MNHDFSVCLHVVNRWWRCNAFWVLGLDPTKTRSYLGLQILWIWAIEPGAGCVDWYVPIVLWTLSPCQQAARQMKQKFPVGLSHRSGKFMCDFCLSILLHCKIQVVIGHVKASPLADTLRSCLCPTDTERNQSEPLRFRSNSGTQYHPNSREFVKSVRPDSDRKGQFRSDHSELFPTSFWSEPSGSDWFQLERQSES